MFQHFLEQALAECVVVDGDFANEGRLADELLRSDVHVAAVELEREIVPRVVGVADAEEPIGNGDKRTGLLWWLMMSERANGSSRSRVLLGEERE